MMYVERFGLASEYGQVRQQAEHGGRYGSDQDDDHPRDREHLGGNEVPDGVADERQPDSHDRVPAGEAPRSLRSGRAGQPNPCGRHGVGVYGQREQRRQCLGPAGCRRQ